MDSYGRRVRGCALVALVFVALSPAWAQLDVMPGVRLYGADIDLDYHLDTLPGEPRTTVMLGVGGGNQGFTYYRQPDGSLFLDSVSVEGTTYDPSDGAAEFRAWNVDWRAGIRQGILWNDATRRNGVEAFVIYRGRLQRNVADSLQIAGAAPDTVVPPEGYLAQSILTGIRWDDEREDARRMTRGSYAEVSIEVEPGSFTRWNGEARGFYPLFGYGAEPLSGAWGASLAGRVIVDVLQYAGTPPYYALQQVGGTKIESGLGGVVRGIDSRLFDAPLKVVANGEIRVTTPEPGIPGLLPGLLAFVDVGYYDFLDLAVETHGASQLIPTTGAGVFLNAFGLASFTGYVQYSFVQERVSAQSRLTPFAFAFGLHF